ncbi:hypothetical protein [Craterilacuibacter sp.]|uniref:hypothetical protein n=1 Tax=Craterilacuibacter sp. TaxID=2870909 RepID=UPI003F2A3EF0
MADSKDIIATPQTALPLARTAVLWPVYLLADAEALSCGKPVSLAPLALLEAGDAGLIESLIPEIRQLAILLAARRYCEAQPAVPRLSDSADWLAARILLLGLTHIALPESALPLLASANRRLAALAGGLGLAAPKAEALLLTPESGVAADLIQAWGETAFQNMMDGDCAISRTRALRVHLRLRASAWLTRLGL